MSVSHSLVVSRTGLPALICGTLDVELPSPQQIAPDAHRELRDNNVERLLLKRCIVRVYSESSSGRTRINSLTRCTTDRPRSKSGAEFTCYPISDYMRDHPSTSRWIVTLTGGTEHTSQRPHFERARLNVRPAPAPRPRVYDLND